MPQLRSIERKEFLSDLLIQACHHNGYGFPEVEWATEFDYMQDFSTPFRADITDRYEEDSPEIDDAHANTFQVSIDTMARGINLIIKRLDLVSPENRKRIMVASKANDASDMDVVDCLAILEIALFGKVVYC